MGFLFFAWIPPAGSRILLRRLLRRSLTHSHRRSTQSLLGELRRAWPPLGPWLPFAWQAQYTQSLLGELRRTWPPLGPRLPFAWQAQCTEPPGRAAARVAATGAAAAFRVAGAVHRPPWTSCGTRGRRWGRGCLSRGRRSTQSLLDELRRAWPPLVPRLPFAWQAQYTEPPGRAAARVAACWGRGCLSRSRRSTQSLLGELRRAWLPLGPRLPFAWQAQYTEPRTSCGARGRRWGRGCFRVAGATYHSPLITHHLSHLTHHFSLTILTAHSPLITCHSSFTTHHYTTPTCPCLITPYHIPTHHSSTSQTSLVTAPLLITTHHSSTSHTSTSHHFSQVHFSSQLITTHHSSTHHHKPSQLHFSHLTYHITTSYHITTHHSSTSHTIFHTPSFIHHLSTHNFVTHHLWHTIFHTPLCHTQSFTHNFVTHHLSHTIFHTQLCHTPSFAHHLSHTSSFTRNFVTHHLSSTSSFVFPSFPVPATTFLAHYWKKLTCGVIRSFYFSIYMMYIYVYIYMCVPSDIGNYNPSEIHCSVPIKKLTAEGSSIVLPTNPNY